MMVRFLAIVSVVSFGMGAGSHLAVSQSERGDGPSMMQIMFSLQEAFDRDRQARVSAAELGVPANALSRIDANEDGIVDYAEFETATLRASRSSLPSDRSDFTHLEEGGFPLNNNPEVVSISEASDVQDDDMVMGVVINGEARAYPVNYMNGPYNEVVNDELGGEKIAPSW